MRSEPDARLMLGIAQLRAGKKDDAQKSFELVKGDPKLERLAHLWEIRAKQPYAGRRLLQLKGADPWRSRLATRCPRALSRR